MEGEEEILWAGLAELRGNGVSGLGRDPPDTPRRRFDQLTQNFDLVERKKKTPRRRRTDSTSRAEDLGDYGPPEARNIGQLTLGVDFGRLDRARHSRPVDPGGAGRWAS